MATKKSSPKKSATKKTGAKKTTPKKASAKKSAPKKSAAKAAAPEAKVKSVNERCKCKQKKNGKFYCFMLQRGSWVQVSGVPYDTQEDCEADCCEE